MSSTEDQDSSNADESQPTESQVAIAPDPVEPHLSDISSSARASKWLMIAAPIVLISTLVFSMVGLSASAQLSGVDKPKAPQSEVPVRISITSKQLVTDGCVGKADFVGLEKAKVEYLVGKGEPILAQLGSGTRSGTMCRFVVTVSGTDAQLFGAVQLTVTFPFADPIEFDFTVKRETPSVEVELSFD